MPKTRQNMSTVRVVAQERLDKPDFDAQGGLVDDHIQQTIGTLMGRGGGAFSPVSFTTSTDGVNYWISFSPFSYYWSQRETEQKDSAQLVPYRGWRGGIARFVPNAPGQAAKWDYTTAQAAGNPGFIWARPATTDVATDARRKWAGGTEQSTSTQTRTVVITQFQFNNLDPDHASNDGWAPVLYIPSWAAHLPENATAVSVWDAWGAYKVAGGTGNFATDATTGVNRFLRQQEAGFGIPSVPAFSPGQSMDADMGLLQLLTVVRKRVQRMHAVDGSLVWYEDAPRDMKVLDGDLTTLATKVSWQDTRLLQVEYGGFLGISCYLKYDSGTATYTAVEPFGPAFAPSINTLGPVLKVAAGVVDIQLLDPPAGYVYGAIHATPYKDVIGMADFGTDVRIAQAPAPYTFRLYFREPSTGLGKTTDFFLTVTMSKL